MDFPQSILTRTASTSFIASSLIHKQPKEAPILYITGSRFYENGVFLYDEANQHDTHEPCTEANLWKELTSAKHIGPVIKRWKYTPFRVVIHQTKRMKLKYSDHGGMSNESDCNYFALLWVPSNVEDGMKEHEFNNLIKAMRSSKYFVNKLNKECIYFSGPSYGYSPECAFDLESLSNLCRSHGENGNITLDIEIAVHELAREVKNDLYTNSMNIISNDGH